MNYVHKIYLIFLNKFSKKEFKKIIINAVIFLIVFFILFFIDFISKRHIFTTEQFEQGISSWKETTITYSFIGFRPLLHHGVTTNFHEYFGFITIHIISWVILISSFFIIIYSRNILFIIFWAVINAGNFGNNIDRIMYNNNVRDILFLPFYDNGTFNFADFFIVSGITLIIISAVLKSIYNIIKSKNKAEINKF